MVWLPVLRYTVEMNDTELSAAYTQQQPALIPCIDALITPFCDCKRVSFLHRCIIKLIVLFILPSSFPLCHSTSLEF